MGAWPARNLPALHQSLRGTEAWYNTGRQCIPRPSKFSSARSAASRSRDGQMPTDNSGGHRAGIQTYNYPNRRYIASTSNPLSASGFQDLQPAADQDNSRHKARVAAWLERLRTREEALRGPPVTMVDQEINSTFPAERSFTLYQPEHEQLDYGDGQWRQLLTWSLARFKFFFFSQL